MSWLVSAKQYIPAVIGEPFGGGYFAGYISHTADGSPTHALIVAPRATGATGTGYTLTTNLTWKTATTTTAGTTSPFDGAANTAAMVTAGIADHPAANFCVGLSIGGFTDWYLPSRLELEIAHFNLKPTSLANNTSAGVNAYSVPARAISYTTLYPSQTYLAAFQSGSSEAFSSTFFHWSSTEINASTAWRLSFGQNNAGSGEQLNAAKNGVFAVRAFRRIAL
jgi:hypothetical protein